MSRPEDFVRGFAFEPKLVNAIPEIWNRTEEEILGKIIGYHYKQPEIEELKVIYGTIVEAWEKEHDVGNVSQGALLRSPWVLFYSPEPGSKVLAQDNEFLRHYVEVIFEAPAGRIYPLLYYCFLLNYPSNLPAFEILSDGITKGFQKAISRRALLYTRREEQSGFLQKETGEKMANEFMHASCNADQYLSKARLVGALKFQGFVEYLFSCVLRAYRVQIQMPGLKIEEKESLIARLKEMAFVGQENLRFPPQRAEYLTALLEPFANGSLEKEPRDQLRDFLIKTFGDPRTDSTHWQGVSDIAMRVIHSWLATVTLNDFFNLFEHVLRNDAQLKRQWKYRRAFWSSYLEGGYIQDAWVALGVDAKSVARQYLKQPDVRYATLEEGAYSDMHSVLIMNLGNLTIAEWSHNGKCHIWREGARKKIPVLYENSYQPRELRMSKFRKKPPFIHYRADRGTWQREVSDYIRKHTGVRIPEKKYMPGS